MKRKGSKFNPLKVERSIVTDYSENSRRIEGQEVVLASDYDKLLALYRIALRKP